MPERGRARHGKDAGIHSSPGPMPRLAALAAGMLAAGLGRYARARIGGQTGDVLGAVQICSEICLMLGALTLLAPGG
ncbi:adenosylcobinamide-GDP ribazoletransferase [Mangrovicoccus ximenensis]|uniref:adenosylcobinamide-GDP ribazoletransferase n=1 Tax=Mangrovicoccus ximenensis TaxID=1911570 RepID=UPI000D34255B